MALHVDNNVLAETGIARQKEASDPNVSCWVAASAGTGKTHVLTDRVIRLLLSGCAPGRLLCLTFTKAAAAEMTTRLFGRLAGWTHCDDAELATELTKLIERAPTDDEIRLARRLFALVLETPGGLKIQTIHAFCQSLLGRFPLEAGIPPHFAVMDERTAEEMLVAARDVVIARARAGADDRLAAALTIVSGHVAEGEFGELMAALLRGRSLLRQLLDDAGGQDGVEAALRRRLGLGPDDTAATVLAAACQDRQLDGDGLRQAAEALQRGSKTDVERGVAIADWLSDRAQREAGLARYCDAFLTREGVPRKRLATKSVAAALPAAEDILGREAERLAAVEIRRRTTVVAEASTALLTLGGALIDTYAREKKRRALLDYDDLILATRGLLQQPGIAPWVLYKLDGGIDHVLLDEAQDTSPDQWRVVETLSDAFFTGQGASELIRTVFAVGDEKQSIFSFQGADPDAFAAMHRLFEERVRQAELPWRTIPLQLSFRSTPAVLGLVDRVFASDQARDGLGFDPKAVIRHDAFRHGQGGRVELWPVVEPVAEDEAEPWEPPLTQHSEQSPREILAARIADTVRGWLDNGERLPARDRAIRAADIMILVRRRDALVEALVRALKVRNIPMAGADRMVLTEQLAVRDLIAAARFALLPDDDLTLAVVLKSPLVGLNEEELFHLAHGRKAGLWRTLVARAGENRRFRIAHDYLAGLLARADFEPPYEFFARILGADGGRSALHGRLGPEIDDPVDEFLQLALAYERANLPTLEGFLHWIESGEAEIKRDLEQGGDQVRVMTVHGAKGLQAPVVILPDTCQVPVQDPRLFWLDGPDATMLWPVRRDLAEPVGEAARAETRRLRDQEYRRLLYVAMTRAEDRLYVCGWQGARGRAAGCWYDLVAAAIDEIGREVDLGFDMPAIRFDDPQTAAPVVRPQPPESDLFSGSLPGWAGTPAPAEPAPPRPLAPSRPDPEEPPPAGPLDDADAPRYVRGRLIHRLLQLLPEVPDKDRWQTARQLLAKSASELPIPARDSLVTETLGVLDDPRFAGLFGPGSRAEVPLAGRVGDQIVAGQVDRLLVGEDDVLVIDFKTNRPPPSQPGDVALAYLRQMAAYRALLRRIFPEKRVVCALLWTDGPAWMPLDDTVLDAAEP